MAATQRSLGKGSCAPGPVPKGKIRVYSMRFCPFAQRTRLVLSAKGIEHETVNVNLKEKPEWFFDKNPLGCVPVLETSSGQLICESLITSEYLDEAYPGKKLFPSEPFAKAQQKMLLEDYSKVVPLFYKIIGSRIKGEDTSIFEAELKEKLSKLNQVLVKNKTKFFGGDSVTMIDYLIWPWFERVAAYQTEQCLNGTPELNCWILRMQEDPTVKALMFNKDTHTTFINLYMTGKPDYDLGL